MGTADGRVLGLTSIVDHGDPASRWNLVVLGDGYQSTEMYRFAQDVDTVVQLMEATPPYGNMWSAINVYRIDVASDESGADDPADPPACGGTGAVVRTYFDATYCFGGSGIHRLLDVNTATVHAVADAYVPQSHIALVIVNSDLYGGSGGDKIPVVSRDNDALDIAFHEIGHAAFGLTDEYESYAGCGDDPPGSHDRYDATQGEPIFPNVTLDPAAAAKWGNRINPATPRPTTSNADCTQCDPQPIPGGLPSGTVGTFEGAGYFHCGLYRPQFLCRMRSLGNPYCAVCQEAIQAVLVQHQ